MPNIRVLVVDDSASMRLLLSQILASDPEIEVVGTASDAYIAREKIKILQPDVLTLDIEMPRMDGLTFLEKLMRGHPMPVVMVSSLTQMGCETTLRALEIGAVDFFPKPTVDTLESVAEGAARIIEKVKGAAATKMVARKPPRIPAAGASLRPLIEGSPRAYSHCVVAVGASTGGVQAIHELLAEMPDDAPGIVIVQHMPRGFTATFAERLDKTCAIRVKEARDGDRVLPGQALIAPGDYHMAVVRSTTGYCVRVFAEAPVNLHRPSVDVLFDSCAATVGPNAVGVILTGMGADGAKGLRRMRDAGARTIAQDEASCVVFGMPREAIACNAVETVRPLPQIAGDIMYLANRARNAGTAS